MSLLARALMTRAREPQRLPVPVPYSLQLYTGGVSGPPKTEAYLKSYGEIGWLFAVVSRIAFSVGDSKWRLMQRKRDGSEEEVFEHPLLKLWQQPNPFMTGSELLEYSQLHMDLSGEAWWILNRTVLGRIAEIWPVSPQRMSIATDRDKFIVGYVYKLGMKEIPFEPDRVIQFKYPNPNDPYRGLGPIQALATDLDTELYSSQWTRNLFLNSARPDGILESDTTLTDVQFAKIQERWRAAHQGVAKAHRMAILEAGLKYKQVSFSPQDLGFDNLRQMNRDAILGIYGVPRSILGITDDVNRANAESGEYTYARWVVLPRLTRFQRKVNMALTPEFGEGLELVPDDPTPENKDALRLEAQVGAATGSLMVDEIRSRLGEDALPDGKGQVFILSPLQSVTPIAELAPQRAMRVRITRALTDSQKDALTAAFVKRLDPNERKFKAFMVAEFAGQRDRLLAELGATKDLLPRIDDDWWRQEIERLIRSSASILLAILAAAAEAAISDYSLGISFDLHNPRVTEWIGYRLQKYSTAVTQTTKNAVEAQLREAEAAGETLGEMIERIRGYYGGIEYRAERVARTEVVGASNRGNLEVYVQAGIGRKQWWTTLDGRQRDAHLAAHGQVRPVNEPFEVGGEYLMTPGDGSPENSINCRCACLPVIGEPEPV